MISTYAQKKVNCEKLVTFNKDDFTGNVSMFTEPVKIYDTKWKHLVKELIDKNDRLVDFEAHMAFYYTNGVKTIAFILSQYDHYVDGIEQVYVKFTDGSVIEFNDGEKGDRVENDAYSSSRLTLFILGENELNSLKDKTVEKFRLKYDYNPREPSSDVTEKEKQSKLIKDTAFCFVEKIPKE
jgi:hypothetical protein